MDHCIESVLLCGDDIEIIIVNDGSTKDNTSEIAHTWQERYPNIIKVIDKENGGHGSAVNAGLDEATGLYFKVVDSDDWLDVNAMVHVMSYARRQIERQQPTDLIIGNYVYDKAEEGKRQTMRYTNVFPSNRDIVWSETGRFTPSQYLLMHSLIYRTQLLKDSGLRLPEHCFYVDNIFAYTPLPYVKTIHYIDCDMYHYFIGRDDQSVHESVMLSRIDQQLKVTRSMIDSVNLQEDVPQRKLKRYMTNYLAMMMCICSIFLRIKGTKESEEQRKEIWHYLKQADPKAYRSVRRHIINVGVNIPTPLGKRIGIGGYHAAQKIFKFN